MGTLKTIIGNYTLIIDIIQLIVSALNHICNPPKKLVQIHFEMMSFDKQSGD